MVGINDYACEGTLTIDSISMNRPAWAVLGDERGNNGLLQFVVSGDVRGEDRVVPGFSGVIPYRRRRTATRSDIRIIVVGDVDETGAPTVDHKAGLVTNLSYIYDNVVYPVGSPTGTRAAVLDLPDGVTRTADIHVVGMTTQEYSLGLGRSVFVGTLQISIPDGRFFA